MAGGNSRDDAEEDVDPASRRLVFWLEMENNMLRERVEEGTLLADAMAKILLRIIADPTPQHLDWAREASGCAGCSPKLEKLFAELDVTKPREASPTRSSRSGSPERQRTTQSYGGRRPTEPMDPDSPRSFAERAAEMELEDLRVREQNAQRRAQREAREAEKVAQKRAAAEEIIEKRRTNVLRVPSPPSKTRAARSKTRTITPPEELIKSFPKVRILEARGLPKQLTGKVLTVGNHDIDEVMEVEPVQDTDGTSLCRLDGSIRIQDSGDGEPDTWVSKVSVRLGAQVVCRTEPIDPAELPERGSKPFTIPLFGKQKGRDGNVATVRQGELAVTRD